MTNKSVLCCFMKITPIFSVFANHFRYNNFDSQGLDGSPGYFFQNNRTLATNKFFGKLHSIVVPKK